MFRLGILPFALVFRNTVASNNEDVRSDGMYGINTTCP